MSLELPLAVLVPVRTIAVGCMKRLDIGYVMGGLVTYA